MRARVDSGGVLGLACVGLFVVVLDVSVVNVALPSMRTGLGFGPGGLQWVVTAYALAFGGLLMLGGRLADLHGHKRVFVAGIGVFSAASLAGGLAAGPWTLVAARAAQGLGAEVLAPATLTLLTTAYPEGCSRTRALATWTAVSIAGGAAGNIVGGALTQVLSWRATLLVNVPIGAVAILVAARTLAPDGPARQRRELDVPGALLAPLGFASLTYGITQVQDGGWTVPTTVIPLLAGAVALVGFVLVEARVAAVPLVPLRLFRVRAISTGNVVMLLAGACLQVPMWYFLTLYMQDVLGYGPLQTGLAFLPHAVMSIVGARLAPQLMERFDASTLIVAGVLLAAAGFWWQSRITADSGYLTGILGPAAVYTFGGGLLNTPLTATVTTGVASGDAGASSGVMNTAKQVGGALGLAVLVTTTMRPEAGTPHTIAAGYGGAFAVLAVLQLVIAAAALTLPSLHRAR
ncbi:MAG: MFS transporter [Streptosporangiales bacterium]|nr:MFS transporter [Streptosporangiales bacterium]